MTRAAHRRFCQVEGWHEVTNARGQGVRHHMTFELALDDGRILCTRISRPASPVPYDPGLASHILRDQLDVTVEEFWTCAADGVPPVRGVPSPPPDTLPAGLVTALRSQLHLTDRVIAGLDRDQAIALLAAHWSEPKD
jgi:hypothetical protein